VRQQLGENQRYDQIEKMNKEIFYKLMLTSLLVYNEIQKPSASLKKLKHYEAYLNFLIAASDRSHGFELFR
jgi:hypothetical protein